MAFRDTKKIMAIIIIYYKTRTYSTHKMKKVIKTESQTVHI